MKEQVYYILTRSQQKKILDNLSCEYRKSWSKPKLVDVLLRQPVEDVVDVLLFSDMKVLLDKLDLPSDGNQEECRNRLRILLLAEEGVQAADTIENPLIKVQSGSFFMGALDSDKHALDVEQPQHQVTITKGFMIGKYPCTQEAYESVMGANPSTFVGATRPVENVSWCDAIVFCNALSKKEGLEPAYSVPEVFENEDEWSQKVVWNKDANGYRLPTEAEWEYCARGGESYLYSGSNNIDEVAWYDNNSNDETHLVGQKKANGFGLHDMSGNVWEWTWDAWKREYGEAGTDPDFVDSSSDKRIFRGGSWNFDAEHARSSFRLRFYPSFRLSFVGFRLVRNTQFEE